MAFAEHTTTAFDHDFHELPRMIAEMGGLAERQIKETIEALGRRDKERARQVIAADAAIDAMQRRLEVRAVETIARRQPVASDLREVVAILRIANELERIGDLAKNIGKRVGIIHREHLPWQSMRGVSNMAVLMLTQLRDVLDSFASRDVAKAFKVWMRDQDVDRLYSSLFRELLIYMMEDPGTITFGVHVVFCTKNLERMGDHATKIAESVCYMVEGRTVWRGRPKADATIVPSAAILRSV